MERKTLILRFIHNGGERSGFPGSTALGLECLHVMTQSLQLEAGLVYRYIQVHRVCIKFKPLYSSLGTNGVYVLCCKYILYVSVCFFL